MQWPSNPQIITDHQIDTESQINVCRDHATALSLEPFCLRSFEGRCQKLSGINLKLAARAIGFIGMSAQQRIRQQERPALRFRRERIGLALGIGHPAYPRLVAATSGAVHRCLHSRSAGSANRKLSDIAARPDLGPRLHPMGVGHGLKLSPCLAMTCTLVGVERLDVPSGADVTII